MRFSLYVIIFFFPCLTYAQLTKVRGKVLDAATKEPLAFVSIAFQGTTIGVISDIEGNYHIETRTASDSIVFSYIGYNREARLVKKAQFQEIDVELTAASISLQEVVVKPSKNPALILLDSLHAHRSINNTDRLEFWESEVYNKMEFDISNVDDNFKKSRLFKQFQFIFDYVDTSLVSGKSYLPIFITETVSDLYYQKNPKKEKEVIRATNVSGVKNDQLSQFTGQMYLKVNPYDNFLQLFGKGFVSPLATFGTVYYKYYLIDSAYIDNRWCYQISYLPRRSQEPTFTGNFWIHDTTFALTKINARLAQDANLNFVNDLIYDLEYQYVGDSLWFTKTEDIFIDFNISDKTSGIFGNKTTSYKNVVVGKKRDDKFFNPQLAQEFITLDSVNKLSNEEWNQLRHMELTKKELQIYDMVDSIKEVPIFQTWVDIITTLIGGHYVCKYFEIGPYYKLYCKVSPRC